MPSVIESALAVDGFIVASEIEMLTRYAHRALEDDPDAPIVELGSYLGRSTIALAGTLATAVDALSDEAQVYAIDPHEGDLGPDPSGRTIVEPTFDRFTANIEAAGVEDWVVVIRALSHDVVWNKPISLLFIDALHDRASVERDFRHFESWLMPGGHVLFHDYLQPFWGVTDFVDELVRDGYGRRELVANLIALQKP